MLDTFKLSFFIDDAPEVFFKGYLEYKESKLDVLKFLFVFEILVADIF